VIYTPPEGEDVNQNQTEESGRVINLDDDGVDPLIKMAVAHYQFEAIHRLPTGTGETGRILNNLYLVKNNLLEFPILYLSKYIIDHKAKYYTALRSITEKNDGRLDLYVLDVWNKRHCIRKIRSTRLLRSKKESEEYIKKKLPDIYSKISTRLYSVTVLQTEVFGRCAFSEEENRRSLFVRVGTVGVSKVKSWEGEIVHQQEAVRYSKKMTWTK